MGNVMFHPLPGPTPAEELAGDVRTFVGDGTPYLKTPGLRVVISVRCGTAPIPLVIEQEFPEDQTLTRIVKRPTPLIRRELLLDGTPVLLRGVQSNDGIWQAGEPVYVRGEWDDAKPAKAAKG